MPVLQALTQGRSQVLDIVFIDCQIRVPCHAKLGKLADLPAREKVCQVGANHTGQRYKCVGATSHFGRHLNHAREYAWHLDDRNLVFPAKGVRATQPNDEIE